MIDFSDVSVQIPNSERSCTITDIKIADNCGISVCRRDGHLLDCAVRLPLLHLFASTEVEDV